MILHLVTALERLYAGNASSREGRACLERQIGYAIDAAVDVIQIREPNIETGILAGIVRQAVGQAQGTSTRIVVNDRLDVALACGAAGVHLKGNSIPADAVRPTVPAGFLVGKSVHSVEEARSAGPVDYLIAGTAWASASKPGQASLLGVEGLAAIVRAVRVPVLAIGGVTPERIALARAAGASGIAGIDLFLGPPDVRDGCRAETLLDRIATLRGV